MNTQRRLISAAAASMPVVACYEALAAASNEAPRNRQVLSGFENGSPFVIGEGGWRGFSDRVMGGVSNADLRIDRLAGRDCLRLTGNVTRESNGGFIQMALYFGRNGKTLDASGWRGVELRLYGNNEDYNVHVRTADCGWHDESYRATVFVEPRWQTIRIPWSTFRANAVGEPLDSASLQRIAILGWMREFDADVALSEIALYA